MITKSLQFYSLTILWSEKMVQLKNSGDGHVPARVTINFPGQGRIPSHSTHQTWQQHQSTMSFAEDLYPFEVSLEQPSWTIWLERSNQPFYSFFLLLLLFWPFHNLVLDECSIFHGFCWVWPQAENGTCVYFTWQSTHGWKSWSSGVLYFPPPPSRWGYNYNLTVWVQLKVRKRYIKFAHMLVPYPHHIPLALYISYATTFGGRCTCIYVCVCTHSRVTILILQSLCKNQTPGFRVS